MADKFLHAFALSTAITGHRTLLRDQQERIERQLDAIFSEMKQAAAAISMQGRTYGFFEEKPVLRLSSCLSEGSDRLAAELALKHGFSLRAFLPFPLGSEVNAMDLSCLECKNSREELRELCSKAESVLQFNPVPPKDWLTRIPDFNMTADDPLADKFRQNAYLDASRAMLMQSDLLIAIWSGQPQAAMGSTYDVICQALKMGMPVCVIRSDSAESVSIWKDWKEFVADEPDIQVSVQEIILKYWGLDNAEMTSHLAQANHNLPVIAKRKLPSMSRLWNKFQKFISKKAISGLDPGPYREETDPVFKLFDGAANYYAAMHRSSFLWLALLGIGAILCAALSAVWPVGMAHTTITALLALGQLVFLIGSLVCIKAVKKNRLQSWLTNFRFLAELMRLTAFSAPLGLSVRQYAKDTTLYGENADWLDYIGRNHIRLWKIPSLNLSDSRQFKSIKNEIEKYLLESQTCYQNIVKARSESMASFLGLIINSLIYLTIIVVATRFSGTFIFNLSFLIVCAAFIGTMGPVIANQAHSILMNAELRRMEIRSAYLAKALESLLAEIRQAESGEELRSVTARTVSLLVRDVKDWKDQYNMPKK